MNKFIAWPLAIDATFRPAYFQIVGELVQEIPTLISENVNIVGSSRITVEQCNELKEMFVEVMIYDEFPDLEGVIE